MENICTKAKNCKKHWTTKWRRKGSLWKLRDLDLRSGLWWSHPAQVVEATPCAAAPRNLFEKSSRWLLKIRQRICHENPTKHLWLLAELGAGVLMMVFRDKMLTPDPASHCVCWRYARTSAVFGVCCCQTVPRPLYLYLYMTCICIWGDPCQGVPHTLGLFVRVGCHKGAATSEQAENLSFNPSFIVFKCLDSHHSFIGLFVGAVKCVTCFSCPESPSHWLLNCVHTRSQSRCKHFPLYTLLKVAQNEAGKI